MLLIGLGIGALASQLGAVTVSAVPDDQSPEVGGVQNTMTNLGASLGTALAGSLMIATLTSSFLTNIAAEPGDPGEREGAGAGRARRRRPVRLRRRPRGGARRSRRELRRPPTQPLDAYADARLDGLRSALAILAVLAVLALFLAQRIPTRPPGVVERRE